MSVPSLFELHDILFNESLCIEFLFEQRVFDSAKFCKHCDVEMVLFVKTMRWRCFQFMCGYEVSVSDDTLFKKARLPYNIILLIGYLWLRCDSNVSIHRAAKVGLKTVRKYVQLFRKLAISSLSVEDLILGGQGVEIEVDECMIGLGKLVPRQVLVDGWWVSEIDYKSKKNNNEKEIEVDNSRFINDNGWLVQEIIDSEDFNENWNLMRIERKSGKVRPKGRWRGWSKGLRRNRKRVDRLWIIGGKGNNERKKVNIQSH